MSTNERERRWVVTLLFDWYELILWFSELDCYLEQVTIDR